VRGNAPKNHHHEWNLYAETASSMRAGYRLFADRWFHLARKESNYKTYTVSSVLKLIYRAETASVLRWAQEKARRDGFRNAGGTGLFCQQKNSSRPKIGTQKMQNPKFAIMSV